jgi:4-amino-4-deoxy-L-arabinose transferase-like glycosyltransferase
MKQLTEGIVPLRTCATLALLMQGNPDIQVRIRSMPDNATKRSNRDLAIICVIAAATFLTCIVSPPHLMDDVDAAQAQLARNMLTSGDWVTGHLDGVIFLDKAPLKYWITASLYAILGVHDWVARLPIAFSAILLSVVLFKMWQWAGSEESGFYAGLAISTSAGLFLFTRVVIPDVLLTLVLTISVWSFLRVLEQPEKVLGWSLALYASLGCAVLLKGLIGLVFPLGTFAIYLGIGGILFKRETLRKVISGPGLLLFLAIAAPWHVLAILRNPPYFDLTLNAGPHFGYQFRGFFWFYFINEQLLRFLNNRWPRDYNTVPRVWFWLYHLIWFFPWSFFLGAVRKADFRLGSRQGKLRVIAGIWILFVMIFFTFSTTQEYYSMPIYPALALLIGSAMNTKRATLRQAAILGSFVCALAALVATSVLVKALGLPTPGDISNALRPNQNSYTLSLGHMTDLTLQAFAYLRVPLCLAAVAFAIGAMALGITKGRKACLLTAAMLVCLFQAARIAMVSFDPYLSSAPLAEVLKRSPKGTLISNGPYYTFSSVYFYTDYQAFILNGRVNNLEYGSYARDGSRVFIGEQEFARVWGKAERCYVATEDDKLPALRRLVGACPMYLLTRAGGKSIWSNLPLP